MAFVVTNMEVEDRKGCVGEGLSEGFRQFFDFLFGFGLAVEDVVN